jgi:ABC-type branched-subunit amino acid transport system permease subunit
MVNLLRLPGARFLSHLAIVFVVWAALMRINDGIDPLMSYYLALAAMYATAMFGMVILVGLSGQVSLGNGALMAIGGYVFALTSLNWQTVPILGWQWNPIWSMIFAGFGGIAVGLIIGWIGARLRGPYLAGLTLGIAVGMPAIATRFPELFGGETGLMLTVPYPAGGYAPAVEPVPLEQAPLDEVPLEQAPLDEVPLEQAPLDEVPLEQAPLDSETAGAGDMLTADNFPSAESSPAAGDMLTADNFPSAESAPSVSALPSSAALPTDIDPIAGGDALLAGSAFVLERWQASLAVTAACIIGFLALNLVRGRQGRVWRAVRDDEVAAAVSGISPAGSKISAFVVSSFFAAIAGAVFAQILSYVGPGAFGLGLSLSLLVGVVLGGRASLGGAIIGGVLLVALPQLVFNIAGDRGWPANVTDNAPNLVYGLLVVLVVLIAPGGILGSLKDGTRRLLAKSRTAP